MSVTWEGGSLAGLWVPCEPEALVVRLDAYLDAEGLSPWGGGAFPSYDRPPAHEWQVARIRRWPGRREGGSTSLVLLRDVGGAFGFGAGLARADRALSFVGFRVYQGLGACLKFYQEGGPQWKEGDDPDHELHYELPQGRPVAMEWRWGGLFPETAAGFVREMTGVLVPFQLEERGLYREWLSRSSPHF